jgi:hypothetical protein
MEKKKIGFPKISQRSAKDPIAITNFLGDTKIRLEITTTKQDWKNLSKYCRQYSNSDSRSTKFESAFIHSFVMPVIEDIDKHTPQFKKSFVTDMKLFAGILYKLFSYCLNDLKKLPEFLRWITEVPILRGHVRMFCSKYDNAKYDNAKRLTAYCIEAIYGHCIKGFNLKSPFDLHIGEMKNQDLQSFYIRYIHEGTKMIKDNYDHAIAFFCYSLFRGYPKLFEQEININKNVVRFYTLLHLAFMHRKDKKRDIAFYRSMLGDYSLSEEDVKRSAHTVLLDEVILLHDILLKIFPWLIDIDNIITRLRWINPIIDEAGIFSNFPLSDKAIQNYRKKHKQPPARLSFK